MTTQPDELKTFIDALQRGDAPTPTSPEEETLSELMSLGHSFTLDERFDHMLHQKFSKSQSMKKTKPALLRRIAAVLALAVLGVALVFAVPDMRAIAQSIIETLFPVAESNQVQYPDEGLFTSVVGSTVAVSSLQGAERALTFPIKIPEVPDELSLREYLVRPDANVSILFYGTYPLTMRRQPPGEAAVLIAQQPLEDAEAVGIFGDQGLQSTLAPDAEMHPITFGPEDAYEGQWVRGLWVPTSSQPEQDGTLTYVWQQVPVYRLRWQDDTYIYEISWYLLLEDRSTETPINQAIVNDLIQIAESIMSGGVENDTQFYETFESAQAEVPFAIALPDRGLLADYPYESYSYNSDIQTAYVQYFEGELINNRRDGNAVTIQQQPLSEIASGVIFGQKGALAAVGPDANIQLYTFGEGINEAPYEGQWVKGMWTQNENPAIEADYIWRSEFPVYRLRWQDETYIYEVKFFGMHDKSASAKDFVLSIAASMMNH